MGTSCSFTAATITGTGCGGLGEAAGGRRGIHHTPPMTTNAKQALATKRRSLVTSFPLQFSFVASFGTGLYHIFHECAPDVRSSVQMFQSETVRPARRHISAPGRDGPGAARIGENRGDGGRGGIRTHGTLTRTAVFK